MKYVILFSTCWLIALSSISCKKNTDVVIQKDTVVIKEQDTIYLQALRTDKYRGLLEVDCVAGGCYLGSYAFASTTVTFYPNDSTRYDIYSGYPGTAANFQYGFSIIKGTDPGRLIYSIDMKGLDSLTYYVHEPIKGMGTPTYYFRGVRR
jgi:hypothetical protein